MNLEKQDNIPDVSICCLTYMHEKYIRKCLDSFLMQQDVTFEILITDDASTDGTAAIITEYADKHPDIIKPILHKENHNSMGIPNTITYNYPRVRGRYVALCEGDDFWTDPYKLKKQLDALDTHPNCHMCVHKVISINESDTEQLRAFPDYSLNAGEILAEDFVKIMAARGYQFQTSSYFMRASDIKEMIKDLPSYRKVASIGDVPTMLYFVSLGNIYYISDSMSKYRRNVTSSLSVKMSSASVEKKILRSQEAIKMYKEFEKSTNYRFDMHILIKRLEVNIAVLNGDYSDAWDIISKDKGIYYKKGREYFNILLSAKFPALMNIIRQLKWKKGK